MLIALVYNVIWTERLKIHSTAQPSGLGNNASNPWQRQISVCLSCVPFNEALCSVMMVLSTLFKSTKQIDLVIFSSFGKAEESRHLI